jgi:aspartate--ammonia ligase
MDAIRKDERLDEIHSHYVDQWDWELIIRREQRNLNFLRETVEKIYAVLLEVERTVHGEFPALEARLPDSITSIHTQDLEDEFPDLTPAEREDRAAARYGAFFLRGIGGKLRSGAVHDLRAADYDDWITETESGRAGLNGDIIVHDATRDRALELSSMGIRVDAESLERQLREVGQEDRLRLEFHRNVVNGLLPLTVGGGLGQSRICMLLLQKLHIAEVQVSVWPHEMREAYSRMGAVFL